MLIQPTLDKLNALKLNGMAIALRNGACSSGSFSSL